MNRTSLTMLALMCAAFAWMHAILPSQEQQTPQLPDEGMKNAFAADAERKEQMNGGPAHQDMGSPVPVHELRHKVYKDGWCCVSEKDEQFKEFYCLFKLCGGLPPSPIKVLGIKKVDGDHITVIAKSKVSQLYSERVVHVHRGLENITASSEDPADADQLVEKPEYYWDVAQVIQKPMYDGFPITWNDYELIIETTTKPPCSYGRQKSLTCCLGCICCCCYDW